MKGMRMRNVSILNTSEDLSMLKSHTKDDHQSVPLRQLTVPSSLNTSPRACYFSRMMKLIQCFTSPILDDTSAKWCTEHHDLGVTVERAMLRHAQECVSITIKSAGF